MTRFFLFLYTITADADRTEQGDDEVEYEETLYLRD